ncbi:hypothetical protein ACVI1L_006103 [Bradyrhizobium sp. USDA 4516]
MSTDHLAAIAIVPLVRIGRLHSVGYDRHRRRE